jgi:hypothetical protein
MLWLCGNMSVEGMLIRKSRVVCCVVISWLADHHHHRNVYETMWKNIVGTDRPQMTIWMHISCWIPKASNTDTEYVVVIAFPLQQCLQYYVIRTLLFFLLFGT